MDCFSMISRGSQRCRFLETCWPLHLLLNLPLAPNPKCQPRIYVPFEKKNPLKLPRKKIVHGDFCHLKKNVWQERLRQWIYIYICIYIYNDINIYIYISYHNVFISIYIYVYTPYPIIMYLYIYIYTYISDFGSKKKIFWLAF